MENARQRFVALINDFGNPATGFQFIPAPWGTTLLFGEDWEARPLLGNGPTSELTYSVSPC